MDMSELNLTGSDNAAIFLHKLLTFLNNPVYIFVMAVESLFPFVHVSHA